ncbi:MAG: hypothetical protein QOF35_472 [Actinomycetota bacterium]|nr:hypothetical protein [Actinomycetota bacterium]
MAGVVGPVVGEPVGAGVGESVGDGAGVGWAAGDGVGAAVREGVGVKTSGPVPAGDLLGVRGAFVWSGAAGLGSVGLLLAGLGSVEVVAAVAGRTRK